SEACAHHPFGRGGDGGLAEDVFDRHRGRRSIGGLLAGARRRHEKSSRGGRPEKATPAQRLHLGERSWRHASGSPFSRKSSARNMSSIDSGSPRSRAPMIAPVSAPEKTRSSKSSRSRPSRWLRASASILIVR